MIAMGGCLTIFPVLAENIEWKSVQHDTSMGDLIRDFGFAIHHSWIGRRIQVGPLITMRLSV